MVDATLERRNASNGTGDGGLFARLRGLFGSGSDKKKKSKKSRGPWWKLSRVTLLGLAVLGCMVTLRVLDPEAVEALRLKTFDAFNRIKPRVPAEQSPVVIIDIDERTLNELGLWPWPRTLLADLIAATRDYGMAVIGFDAVFKEVDKTSPSALVKTMRGADPALLSQIENLPDNETLMADTMRTMRTVVGQAGTRNKPLSTPPPEAQQTSVKAFLKDKTARHFQPQVDGEIISDEAFARSFMLNFSELISNVPEIEAAASGRAFFSVDEEFDGIVRRVPVMKIIQGTVKPTLSLEMLRVGFNGNSILTRVDPGGIKDVVLQVKGTPGFAIPTDEKGRVWVYYAEEDKFNTEDNSGRLYVSATDVINKRVPPERLAGRLALVGTSAVGLLDIRSTPISPRLPGVEVHANLIETIMQGTILKHPVQMHIIEILVFAIAGLILIVSVPRLGPFVSLAFVAVVCGGLVWASWHLFSQQLTFLDPAYPSAATILLYAVLAFSNYARDAQEKKQVRGAFAQYLSPDLVEQLAENPDQLVLGGETKKMTMLFCDVRGFTSISELYKTDPQGLTVLINRLLTPLTDSILKKGGTIDKYMGDCIMAFWNAPLDVPQQEIDSCEAALDMYDQLDALNTVRKQEAEESGMKYLPLNIGIGINTGDVVVGNMGSEQRFDYSVLGDAVNLAARLEGQSKSYGVKTVIGDTTNDYAKEQFATLELDLIAVKGKSEAVRIFTLLGRKDMLESEEFKTLRQYHEDFLKAYRSQEWEHAEEIAATAKGRLNGLMDEFYSIYCDRITEFRENPPPADWDGVYVATTK
jgi:adenylate cyclase